jgi:hypothetical protein
MQERFRIFRCASGNFYARDEITGRSESLGTSDRTQAKQLLVARNQAAAQPQLNRTMAKAYLSAKSPDLLTRTWADVMEHYSVTGFESTHKRKATAFRSRPFAHLRGLALMDTEAAHLLAVLEHEWRETRRTITCSDSTLRAVPRMAADAGNGRRRVAGGSEKEVHRHHGEGTPPDRGPRSPFSDHCLAAADLHFQKIHKDSSHFSRSSVRITYSLSLNDTDFVCNPLMPCRGVPWKWRVARY